MRLNQDLIQRMFDGRGGASGGGSSLDPGLINGLATEMWTEENYVSKTFFNELFIIHKKTTTTVYDGDTVVSTTTDTSGTFAPNEIPSQEESTDEETGYRTVVVTEVDNIEAKKGLWTDFFLSALGLNGSGGGGGIGDVTWQALGDNTDTRQIASSHLTTALGSALAGYATQSWVTSQNYVTSSAISDMATKTWVNNQSFVNWTALGDTTTTQQIALSHLTTALSGYATQTWVTNNFSTPSSVATQMQTYAKIQNGTITIGDNSLTPITSVTGTFWGKSFTNGGTVNGTVKAGTNGGAIEQFHSVEMNSAGTLAGYGGFIDFHYYATGSTFDSTLDYTSRIIESEVGVISIMAKNNNATNANKLAGLLVGAGYDGSYIQIGDLRIVYDSTNNALKVVKLVSGSEVAANFYATGSVSALGYGAGGGGGTGDVTWTNLADNTDTRPIALSHLTGALAGYATQSWVQQQIAGGTVTSATRLSTPRTIWGQNFDGTGNVTGNLELLHDNKLYVRKVSSQPGNHAGFLYDIYGNEAFVFTTGYANARIVFYTKLGLDTYATNDYQTRTPDLCLYNNNVGIGTHSPSYKLDVSGDVRASSFVKLNGTSSQFLKADGSTDSNTYALSSSLSNYLPLTGGTMSNTNLVTNLNAQYLNGYGAYNGTNNGYVFIGDGNFCEMGTHIEFHYEKTSGLDYSTILACTGNHSNFVSLPSTSGTLALTTDNVASATKLQTARTIWGQSFDGSANVSGMLSDVDGIRNNGYYFIFGTNNDWVSTIDRASDAGPIFGYGQGRNNIPVYYTGYGIKINGNGVWNATSGINITTSNNVGIGKAAPEQKLDVDGGVRASSFVKLNGTSSQFLKADGSVDSNTYALSSSLSNYLPLTGGTMSNANLVVNLNAQYLNGYGAFDGSNNGYVFIGDGNFCEMGMHIEFHYDKTSGLDYSTTLQCTGNYQNVVSLPSTSGTLALTTDNVASATKLQTARTIWGQSFDGSGNVTGNLELLQGNKLYVRKVSSQSGNHAGFLYDINGNEAFVFTTGYANARIVFYTKLGLDTYASYDFQTRTPDLCLYNNNVGIGTHSPSYKLHVSGTCAVNGGLYKSNTESYPLSLWRGDNDEQKLDIYVYDVLAVLNASDSDGWSSFSFRTNGTEYVRFDGRNKYVGIGTTAPSYTLHVAGTMYASGAATLGSTLSVGGTTTVIGNVVSGNTGGAIEGFHSWELNTHNTAGTNIGGFLDFHYNGTAQDYSVRLIEKDYSGVLQLMAKDTGTGNAQRAGLIVGAGTYTSFIQIGNGRIVWNDSDHALRIVDKDGNACNLYATGGISALGYQSGGGGGGSTGVFSTSITPDTTGVYDLGTSTYKWRNLYLAGANGGNGFSIITSYSSYVYIGSLNKILFGADVEFEDTAYVENRMGIGVKNGNYDLYVYGENEGNAYFAGDVSVASLTNRSDMRLKDVVGDVNLSVQQIASAPTFKFRFKEKAKRTMVGTSAQYWDAVLPESVTRDADGILGLDYGVTALVSTIILAKGMTEHERRITKLEMENAELRARIKDLEEN